MTETDRQTEGRQTGRSHGRQPCGWGQKQRTGDHVQPCPCIRREESERAQCPWDDVHLRDPGGGALPCAGTGSGSSLYTWIDSKSVIGHCPIEPVSFAR